MSMLLKRVVKLGVLIGLVGAVGAHAAPPPCRTGDDPRWCDPKMVALKMQDAQGTLNIRLQAGAPMPWRKKAWTGPLNVQAERVPAGAIKLTVWLPESAKPVKTAVIKKGEAVELTAGKDVPAAYFGSSVQSVKFIADE